MSIDKCGKIFYDTKRAGGPFLLKPDGAALLLPNKMTERRRVNLSYWIYDYNFQHQMINTYEMFEEKPNWGKELLELDEAWVERYRDWEPSAEDRILNFLRESIRDWDAGEGREPSSDLKMAAGGCRNDPDLRELENYAAERGWLGVRTESGFKPTRRVNLSARIHVDEKTREQGRGQQGFVAMWFDPSMDDAYKCGFKLAIQDAGYKPRLIKEKEYLGGVVDEILAEIRKSRFVVADFTSIAKAGARGGVYFEAGFAYGLDIPVFLTCRKGYKKGVHFDIGHLNRIEWTTPKDLRKKLKNSILAVLDRGPLNPSNGDQEVVGSNSSLAA
ncbi:MAG: hypothetical protein F4Y08_05015 [Caldilineaceae bacterium SB0662_bin_9]|uniref:Nucleoside 2-deoxyribosyltransferase n=1 Tax=Caldilineaceae bacterium SB0662_bin_9 TaxID=2605258 RepID=A0A6B1DR58_9CHLR|nr:hypothetical protein [Caldilineaceae bacterium SB0662_bin_9]